jgi:hypothetical protein
MTPQDLDIFIALGVLTFRHDFGKPTRCHDHHMERAPWSTNSLAAKRREGDLMEYLVAVILGLAVAGFAATSGFDRDRAFYPTVLIVIASYYALFAVMGTPRHPALEIEIAVGLVFSVLALLGFKQSMWLAAAGIAGHGFFDFFVHHALVTNPGMPVWWPGFCGTIDIVLGGWLAIRLWKAPKAGGGKSS